MDTNNLGAENAHLKVELINAGLPDMVAPTTDAEARALSRLADRESERIAQIFRLPANLVVGHDLSPEELMSAANDRESAHLRAMGYTGTLEEMRARLRADEMAMWAELLRRTLMTSAERAIEDRHRGLTWRAAPYLLGNAPEYALLPRRERKRIERIMGLGFPARCRVIRAERARIHRIMTTSGR